MDINGMHLGHKVAVAPEPDGMGSSLKVGSWLKGGVLHHHGPTFFQDHTAGLFHKVGLLKNETVPGHSIVFHKVKP